jgi:filamentous hemagglutinin family protein
MSHTVSTLHRPQWNLLFRTTSCLATLALVLQPPFALAQPSGGVVSGGAASINTSGTSTTITQSSQRAVIDWQGFDVQAGEAVRFDQPAAGSIALNRIHDSKLSAIDGQLTANGQVWFVNPHGMVFGPNAQVNVGGLLATTSDIGNDRFMAGDYRFDVPGDPDAAIVNRGRITIAEGGLAALVART